MPAPIAIRLLAPVTSTTRPDSDPITAPPPLDTGTATGPLGAPASVEQRLAAHGRFLSAVDRVAPVTPARTAAQRPSPDALARRQGRLTGLLCWHVSDAHAHAHRLTRRRLPCPGCTRTARPNRSPVSVGDALRRFRRSRARP